jgi:hypothetical protein
MDLRMEVKRETNMDLRMGTEDMEMRKDMGMRMDIDMYMDDYHVCTYIVIANFRENTKARNSACTIHYNTCPKVAAL